MKKLGIYVHIPFCVSKCAYCDFFSGPADVITKERYLLALQKQIEETATAQEKYQVVSVYFGGGTPSSVDPVGLMQVLGTILRCYNIANNCEISIECNPGTVDENSLSIYKKSGFNRLSFGLQSVNDDDLRMLGRIHSFSDFLKSYEAARKVGFDNINVDLISAIPNSNINKWQKTLKQVAFLKPEHISAYSLILEEGTPLFDRYEGGEDLRLPDEDEERNIYHMTDEILSEYGYQRYEISNYSKPGYECKHNILYWDRTEYMGFGAGAASFVGEQRFNVKKDIQAYIENPVECYENIENLTDSDAMAEFMFLGLRMIKGVSISDFRLKFGRNIMNIYGNVIKKYSDSGHLLVEGDRIRLSHRGIDVSNYIFSDFI